MNLVALTLLVLAGIAAVASADTTCSGPNARVNPPKGAIVVDATGKYAGSFKTVSQGVAHIPNTADQHTLFLFPGVYQEQVTIPKLNGRLVLQGYTCNTMKYVENKVTITHKMAQKDLPPGGAATRNERVSTMVFKSGSGVRVYNLNIANTAGKIDHLGQAVAVYVADTNYGFYACKLTGYQDTLFANNGRELFARSYISGAVDFVFGLHAKAWFESCDVESVGAGCITANGNSDGSGESEFVFNNARVFGSGKGTAYLGRPWRPYARVVFQNSDLGAVINLKGWQAWDNVSSTKNVFLKEYKNRGVGASPGTRIGFSGQLTAPVAITQILGGDYKSQWFVDTQFL